MAKQFLVLAVLLVACLLDANSKIAVATTVYDVLAQNNLPRGLLPLGAKSYVLQPGGALQVTFPKECNFFITVGGTKLQFRYGTSVSGIIKSGSISAVSGVRFQVEFAWLGINQVTHTGSQINIQLETSTKSYPASAFSQSPSCNSVADDLRSSMCT